MNFSGFVTAGREKPIQNIVLIRRNFKTANRQTHFRRQPTGKDIAKVSSRNNELDLFPFLLRNTEIGIKIINALRENPREIDRIDRGNRIVFAKIRIAENLLQNRLSVVECSFNRQRKNIRCSRTGHLPLLKRRDPTVRIKDENIYALFSKKSMNRRRSGIPGSCPENVDRTASPANLFFVKIAEQLKSKILEGQRRPMEKLENEKILVEPHQRRHIRMIEFLI